MGYAVYHVQKGSGSAGGLGHHIDRTPGKEHLYKHADSKKIELNQHFQLNKYTKLPLYSAIKERIKDGYKVKGKDGEIKTIRKDAKKYLAHMLTGSHEDMHRICGDKEKKKAWIQKNYDFISKKYGAKNIVRFELHMDEHTPHIHCITVPLTEDGRLSAKELVGNNKSLQETQDLYAEYMKEFNLDRGKRGSKTKRTTVKEYYSALERAQNVEIKDKPKTIKIDKPSRFSNLTEWTEEVNKQINDLLVEQQAKKVRTGAYFKASELLMLNKDRIGKDEIKVLNGEIEALNGEIKTQNTEWIKKANKAVDKRLYETLDVVNRKLAEDKIPYKAVATANGEHIGISIEPIENLKSKNFGV